MNALTAIESPVSTTDTSTTNEPTTTKIDLPMMTEIMSTTTADVTEGSSTTAAQQPTTINAIKDALTCSQSIAPGLITGVAVGGVIIGVLLILIATLIIAAIARLTKKKQSTLALLAVNQTTQEDKMKDMEMENVEEPMYSIILPNSAVGDHQMDMNMNECYGTLRANAAAP